MTRVVNGYTVEQDQVLIGTSSPDIQARSPFGAALYARHELNGFQHIAFAKQHRQRLHLVERHINAAHLRLFNLILYAFANDFNFLKVHAA